MTIALSNDTVRVQNYPSEQVYPNVKVQKKVEDNSWFGNQLRKIGMTDTADWLEDKDKICTDGKDDGKLSLGEGVKSFAKGLFGGIPKAIINHPIISGLAVVGGAAAMVATGGAAAPILWGIGAAGVALSGGTSIYKYATAKTDGDAKNALEGVGTSTQAAIMLGMSYQSTVNAAKSAGVKTDGNFFEMLKSSAEVSKTNAKANYLYLKDGVVTQKSNIAKWGTQNSTQGNGKPLNAYKIDLSGESVEANLAKNPGLAYDAEAGKYYVPTSWGGSYVDPNAPKGYMFVEYGPGDVNAVEGIEFGKAYVDYAQYTQNLKVNVDAGVLNPGQKIVVTKQAPAAFKVVPEGTGYIGRETLPGTVDHVEPLSVLRFDNKGFPYQSSVEFMFDNFKFLTPKQIAQLKAVAPQVAAKYGY